MILLLARTLCIDDKIGVASAFSNSGGLPSRFTTSTFGCQHHTTGNALLASKSASPEQDLSESDADYGNKKMVLVLGGSGYIGRRVCRDLVEADETTRVVSISRSGKPPSWSLGIGSDTKDSSSWSKKVEWIQHNISSELGGGETSLVKALCSICKGTTDEEEPAWETTIVGCIGNVNPNPTWEGLWGLNYEDDQLLEENGRVYELFLNQTEALRTTEQGPLTLNRCVLLSLDYTCQKCLEGPIEGYLDGKRLAERKLLEAVSTQHGGSIADPSNLEKVVVIGLPNFVFGGKRFPTFGKIYRKLIESPFAKAYVGGNQALRSLSVAAPEDWVEAMVRIVCDSNISLSASLEFEKS